MGIQNQPGPYHILHNTLSTLDEWSVKHSETFEEKTHVADQVSQKFTHKNPRYRSSLGRVPKWTHKLGGKYFRMVGSVSLKLPVVFETQKSKKSTSNKINIAPY